MARLLVHLLDPWMAAVEGCPIRDNPFDPHCARCRRLAAEQGRELRVEWVPREARFGEKLATPDVTMADLIGDIDPIKAAREKRDLSDEEVIHYGIIPRTNRGIFVINELPDLQPRIQVGLLNILEEQDIQIRGFPVRVPLDVLMVFTANPEDYTNRGNIITPLKDRIDSQILTHYPESVQEAMAITAQEAWTDRGDEIPVPGFLREMVEEIAFTARRSDHVDQGSGVSARLPITAYELLLSNVERRCLKYGEKVRYPRMCDLYATVEAVTGKIELVYEGEQEGPQAVAWNLLGRAVLSLFNRTFPKVYASRKEKRVAQAGGQPPRDGVYKPIADHFSNGRMLEIDDTMPFDRYLRSLAEVPGLRKIVDKHVKPGSDAEAALAMEWVLEALHQSSVIARETVDGRAVYSDMLARVFREAGS
jgi:magnesium chelatase subunit I